MLDELKDDAAARVSEAEASEMREVCWERAVVGMPACLKRDETELHSSAKGAPWKVAIARLLRERYLVPNRWIATRLKMGQIGTTQSAVSRFRTCGGTLQQDYAKLKMHEMWGCPYLAPLPTPRGKRSCLEVGDLILT